jgi:hypothetical protein
LGGGRADDTAGTGECLGFLGAGAAVAHCFGELVGRGGIELGVFGAGMAGGQLQGKDQLEIGVKGRNGYWTVSSALNVAI